MFEILAQFVEKELKPLTLKDIEKEKTPEGRQMFQRQYNDEQEMLRLYDWWKKRVAKEKYTSILSVMEDITNVPPDTRSWQEIEKAEEQELLDNCKRLIDVSPSMWT